MDSAALLELLKEKRLYCLRHQQPGGIQEHNQGELFIIDGELKMDEPRIDNLPTIIPIKTSSGILSKQIRAAAAKAQPAEIIKEKRRRWRLRNG